VLQFCAEGTVDERKYSSIILDGIRNQHLEVVLLARRPFASTDAISVWINLRFSTSHNVQQLSLICLSIIRTIASGVVLITKACV
jgi:hypothetical protein